jgi:hypothetical protein
MTFLPIQNTVGLFNHGKLLILYQVINLPTLLKLIYAAMQISHNLILTDHFNLSKCNCSELLHFNCNH